MVAKIISMFWTAVHFFSTCQAIKGLFTGALPWVPEGFGNFIAKDDRPAKSRDVTSLESIWIIFDETTYKDAVPKTLDELRQ